MFPLDLPPDVNVTNQQVLIVGQVQSTPSANDLGPIGVCHLVRNRIDPLFPAEFAMTPSVAATNYFRNVQNLDVNYHGYPVKLIEGPKFGSIKDISDSNIDGYIYYPQEDYLGDDKVIFEMEIDGSTVQIVHFIRVLKRVGDSMYENETYCPNGEYWKISVDSGEVSLGASGSYIPVSWRKSRGQTR